jgi:hypothetical protein
MPYDSVIVREAVMREYNRSGNNNYRQRNDNFSR